MTVSVKYRINLMRMILLIIDVSSNLATALDRAKKAFILHGAAKNYEQDVLNMSLSLSSINRSLSKHRRDVAARTKASFLRGSVTVLLVLHFIGKLLPVITEGPGKEE